MIQFALKLATLGVDELKTLALSMKQGLTSNANFPAPKISPGQIQTMVDMVTTQETAVSVAESNVGTQRDLLKVRAETLGTTLTAAATDCQNVVSQMSDVDAKAKMQSANIPLKSEASAPPAGVPPQNFSVTHGDHEGYVDGQCHRVKGARMYKAEHATSASGPWTVGYEGTRSSFTMRDLPVGQECWFRMAAFVGGVWTEWSDPARCRVV